eukprot:799868-Ditylum_brightwellii.AAC.1
MMGPPAPPLYSSPQLQDWDTFRRTMLVEMQRRRDGHDVNNSSPILTTQFSQTQHSVWMRQR